MSLDYFIRFSPKCKQHLSSTQGIGFGTNPYKGCCAVGFPLELSSQCLQLLIAHLSGINVGVIWIQDVHFGQ